jgi:hypothetical protein
MMTNDIFQTKIVFTISTNNNFQKIGPFKSIQSELKKLKNLSEIKHLTF